LLLYSKEAETYEITEVDQSSLKESKNIIREPFILSQFEGLFYILFYSICSVIFGAFISVPINRWWVE